MQKLQDSVFSIIKTKNLSPAVFSYLQPSEDFTEKTPQGGILNDTKHGWLALGPKFCVVDLRSGVKVAARTFGAALSNFRTTITSVVELPTPLTVGSQQLIISLQCEDIAGMICIFNINGSQILRCIQTEVVVTQLAVTDHIPHGPLSCFDGVIMAGTKSGEVFVFDLNRACLIQALKDISQGYEHLVRSEVNAANIMFLSLNATRQIEGQRDLAVENDDHIAVLLNENSIVEGEYIFRNPDGTVRMKAKRDHIRVTVVSYIPQLGSMAVGFNFGAFQIWNLVTLDLEYTSQVNVECLPVTHFGFQEPCDDPRAFCYLWVVYSVIDRFDEEEFPLAVMYSLTYQGKRMLSDTKYLYQEFLMATIRFQVELSTTEKNADLVGGRCVSCHTYTVNSTLGGEGEESMLNICQLVWECWGENANSSAQYGMLLFDLDQWYKDQMPATYQLQSTAFMSATCCAELGRGASCPTTLDVRLDPRSVRVYSAATRLEEHFYPNSLHYDCISLNTSEAVVLSTTGIQRQIINSMDEVGPTALLNPTRLYNTCVAAGLVPLYLDSPRTPDQEDQRRYLLSVALEARLSRFLTRCAHDWATGSHTGAGCTLTFLVDWCWQRAIELKENARELTSPLFASTAIPDRNVVRCLEHCVQQLTQLTGLLDSVLTKCCNLVVPEALSEMEEKYKGIGTVSLYFQVVQWFLRCGLLPERNDALPYPGGQLLNIYTKRRLKLHRLQDHAVGDENAAKKSCPLLYIDQLIEQEFGGEMIHQVWQRGGSECHGLYPPPSLYSLLRLYLLPDIAEEHKHSLVLYLLLDYSMVYDEVRYEAVIRRLMQFPTMFGLSNTVIKATQAFWHLDHRDFDFALDQLQCLTGNTLTEWQHTVVLSSLLAQKKSQSALQYLHVRKPAPIQSNANSRVNDNDKLEDWQSCCNLYLARGLVFQALDVIRACVQNAGSFEDKAHVLNFFFKGCRNTAQLSKILQVTLLPFEERVFIKYLEQCSETQTTDVLIMYLLQQARYLEAQQYNNKLKSSKPRAKDFSGSVESLADTIDRESARDTLVEVACASLPAIANVVAHCAFENNFESHVVPPMPTSVYIQAKSPKNTFIYKSSFIQDTIENASETWMNKPTMRRGLKRALNIEETPFLCTPKLSRNKSIFTEEMDCTPPKRSRLDLTGTPRTPRMGSAFKCGEMSQQMAALLDMPEIQSPEFRFKYERSGADTPHSILKSRPCDVGARDTCSPADSRYLDDSDDDMLETASNNTHYSDSTNKHLRFTIPTASEAGSTPSPVEEHETERFPSLQRKETDMSLETFVTTESHSMDESHQLESPPKKQATVQNIRARKTYKDTVRGRRSLSISANSSLSEDPNTSIESIADIPITLINPRYSAQKRRVSQESAQKSEETIHNEEDTRLKVNEDTDKDVVRERSGVKKTMDATTEHESTLVEVPKTPKGRKSIRSLGGQSTPLLNRSRSVTPERQDSPITPLHNLRMVRSRSRTPEISPRSSPLVAIPEQPREEVDSDPHPVKTTLSVPRQLRSRSRTPERIEKVMESPKLEAITESPATPDLPTFSPTRRNLRSRSRTPDIDTPASPQSARTRKTPEKIMSPKRDPPKSAKKSLSRIVLESNAFAKTKEALQNPEHEEQHESVIECTPLKPLKPVSGLMDVTFSPIISKSVLHSSHDTVVSETSVKETVEITGFSMNETRFGKSVLGSYDSTVDTSQNEDKKKAVDEDKDNDFKSVKVFSLTESYFEKSVLHSYQSSVPDTSTQANESKSTETQAVTSFNVTDFNKSVLGSCDNSAIETNTGANKAFEDSSLMTSDSDISEQWKAKIDSQAAVIQKEKEKIVEIEREINEIEGDMSHDEHSGSGTEGSESEVLEVSEDEENDDEEIGEEESDGEPENLDEEEESGETDNSSSEQEPSTEEEDNSEVISIQDSDEEAPETLNKETVTSQESTEQVINVQSEETKAADNVENSEVTVDPLNQAQLSMMTDDNSVDDHSDLKLNYSDDIVIDEGGKSEPMEAEVQPASEVEEPIQDDIELKQEVIQPMQDVIEPIPEVIQPIQGVIEPIPEVIQPMQGVIEPIPEVIQPILEVILPIREVIQPMQDVIEPIKEDIEPIQEAVEIIQETEPTNQESEPIVQDEKQSSAGIAMTIEVEIPMIVEDNVIVEEQQKMNLNPTEVAVTKEVDTVDAVLEKDEQSEIKEKDDDGTDKVPDAKTMVGVSEKVEKRKKRTKSTSSNKSKDEEMQEEVMNTPRLRKRSLSTAENIKESVEVTPSRRRSKTPTTDPRKILTRRASKEISEKIEESIDEGTPRRRSTRAASRNVDDTASIASGTSAKSDKSTKSKASEDAETKARKARKSVLPTKPDLSVIPETESLVEDPSRDKSDLINEYAKGRRLTRHQRALLDTWLEVKPSPRRRVSVASRTSTISERDDDEASSVAFDVQPIDRISLMNKGDFEGSPDSDETAHSVSPNSIASDAAKQQQRSRLTRAKSESKSTPKANKPTRRISVDIVSSYESPGSVGSPATRARRASFTRACEAIITPKRRTSTDVKKADTDSQHSSPLATVSESDAPATPSRRARRGSSASQSKDHGKKKSGTDSEQGSPLATVSESDAPATPSRRTRRGSNASQNRGDGKNKADTDSQHSSPLATVSESDAPATPSRRARRGSSASQSKDHGKRSKKA